MPFEFDELELLPRAVRPANQRPDFWRNGKLSSAAFKDKRGLSVVRTYDRPLQESVNFMRKNFVGVIVSVTVEDCNTVQAYVKYCPSSANEYHSEIHGSKTEIMLSDAQALSLARKAKLEFSPKISC